LGIAAGPIIRDLRWAENWIGGEEVLFGEWDGHEGRTTQGLRASEKVLLSIDQVRGERVGVPLLKRDSPSDIGVLELK